MTEEKETIYIDGVDVAGCEFWQAKDSWGRINACSQRFTRQCECANNPVCYYKQLMFANKKLEAAKTETEKLVSTIWIMSGEITDLRNEKERLHNELVEAKGEQLGTLIRYNKILEGIKEIINDFSKEDIVTLPDLSKEQNYKMIAEQYAEPIKKIISKINEVLK